MATEELSSSLDQMAMPGRHLFQRATHSAHQDQTCRCSAIYLPRGVLSIGLGGLLLMANHLGQNPSHLAVSSQQVFVRKGRGRGRERERRERKGLLWCPSLIYAEAAVLRHPGALLWKSLTYFLPPLSPMCHDKENFEGKLQWSPVWFLSPFVGRGHIVDPGSERDRTGSWNCHLPCSHTKQRPTTSYAQECIPVLLLGGLSNSSSIGFAVYGYPLVSLGVGFHMPLISMVTMLEFLVWNDIDFG